MGAVIVLLWQVAEQPAGKRPVTRAGNHTGVSLRPALPQSGPRHGQRHREQRTGLAVFRNADPYVDTAALSLTGLIAANATGLRMHMPFVCLEPTVHRASKKRRGQKWKMNAPQENDPLC